MGLESDVIPHFRLIWILRLRWNNYFHVLKPEDLEVKCFMSQGHVEVKTKSASPF